AALNGGKHLLEQRQHLRQRCAEHNQVGVAHRFRQIARAQIHGFRFLTFRNAGGAADVAGDFTRESAFPDCQPERPAEQANSDNGYLPKMHGESIRMEDGGWKIEMAVLQSPRSKVQGLKSKV